MNIEAVLLSVLLVLLSAILKSGITNSGSTTATAWEIGLGLPVDLSFVGLSLVLTAKTFLPEMELYKNVIWVGILVLAILQLIFLYRPSKGFYECREYCKAFFIFVFNFALTIFCLGAILTRILAL